jgi:hypothetical protein
MASSQTWCKTVEGKKRCKKNQKFFFYDTEIKRSMEIIKKFGRTSAFNRGTVSYHSSNYMLTIHVGTTGTALWANTTEVR